MGLMMYWIRVLKQISIHECMAFNGALNLLSFLFLVAVIDLIL